MHVTDRAKGSWNVWRIMKTRTSTLFANYPAGNEWYKFISKVYTPPDTITTEPNVNFNKLLSYDGDQLSKHHSLNRVSSKGDKEHSACCSTRTRTVSRPAPWQGAHQLRLSPRLSLSRILELRLRVQFLKLKNKSFGDLKNSKSICFKRARKLWCGAWECMKQAVTHVSNLTSLQWSTAAVFGDSGGPLELASNRRGSWKRGVSPALLDSALDAASKGSVVWSNEHKIKLAQIRSESCTVPLPFAHWILQLTISHTLPVCPPGKAI